MARGGGGWGGEIEEWGERVPEWLGEKEVAREGGGWVDILFGGGAGPEGSLTRGERGLGSGGK